MGKAGAYRFFAKYSGNDYSIINGGNSAGDAWDVMRGGFRSDWAPSENDRLTFQGDIYSGDSGQTMDLPGTSPSVFPSKVYMSGGNLLARWERQMHGGDGLSLQTYYDHYRRKDAYMKESRDTVDLDFTFRVNLLRINQLNMGFGYRWTGDHTQPGVTTEFIPRNRQDSLYSMFIQDDISLLGSRLHLILGSKVEHNDYTGFEFQPSARLLWTPTTVQSFWMSVSRAVRTPSRTDHDLSATLFAAQGTVVVPPGITVPSRTIATLTGSDAYKSEELVAYEIGYRAQPAAWISYDLTAFYKDYNRLRSADVGTPVTVLGPGGVTTTVPLQMGNGLKGETFGVEAYCNLQPTDWLRVAAGYSWLRMNLDELPSLIPGLPGQEYNNGPRHQFSLSAHIDLPENFEFDPALYYVSKINQRKVPGYVRLDLRIGWKPLDWLELSVKAENLLQGNHAEFGDDLGLKATRIERSFWGQAKFYY
jgi:iron complex outermembrane recepter protein